MPVPYFSKRASHGFGLHASYFLSVINRIMPQTEMYHRRAVEMSCKTPVARHGNMRKKPADTPEGGSAFPHVFGREKMKWRTSCFEFQDY